MSWRIQSPKCFEACSSLWLSAAMEVCKRKKGHEGKQFHLRVFVTYPVGEDGEDELAGLEGVEDPLDEAQVGGQGHVALEAHVGELGLRGDVDRHVLAL